MKNTLLLEEKRATIVFLWLFYCVFFVYDIYYQFFPFAPWYSEMPNPAWYGLHYIKYAIILLLLPLSIYLIRHGKQQRVKYIVVITYVFTNLVTDSIYYLGSDHTYSSGDLVELIIILFSPIFINKRFFYLASLGILAKYALLGVILQDLVVFFPIIAIFILSIIAYILLHRFISYVEALKSSYGRQLEGMVKGIINTLELKDPYTRGHSERVAEYALRLAKATGRFKDYELDQFYYACLLHDVGKVNIPDSILTKAGRLTDKEYEVIKTHPVVGAKAVEDVEGIKENIDVIYHHHERWDGGGYPDKLKGTDTPILARITAVADAFDAMTSTRSYRPALSFEEAHRRVIEGMGTQFDPGLETYFNQVYPDWVEISKRYHLDEGRGQHESPQIEQN